MFDILAALGRDSHLYSETVISSVRMTFFEIHRSPGMASKDYVT